MFLRQNKRRKNGKTHRYFSVVENRRTGAGVTTQRPVLYLGEINDSQQQAWRRTLEVFDEDRRQYCELSLFPDDRPLPPGAANAISVKLDRMQLRRPRSFGDCWLGCWLWDRLHLSSFLNMQLIDARGEVPWAKVLRSNAIQADATTMWSMYVQLTWIESAFKSMKSGLAIRPIFHQVQPHVEAHLFVAFMGYCLMAALRKHLEPAAPGLSPKAVLEQLEAIKMVDVCLPTSDGRWLIMPRHTEPEQEQLMLLEKLGLTLPAQPPPRLRGGKLLMPQPQGESVSE